MDVVKLMNQVVQLSRHFNRYCLSAVSEDAAKVHFSQIDTARRISPHDADRNFCVDCRCGRDWGMGLVPQTHRLKGPALRRLPRGVRQVPWFRGREETWI
jgi:hypothetical protein